MPLTISRVASVVLLLTAGFIIKQFGRRRTIVSVLLFTAFFTALIGVAEGRLLSVAVVAQPALLALMFPAMLSCFADIGDAGYQNITYALIITVGISVGTGVAPALLGIFGDLGIGGLGFVCLSGFMLIAVGALMCTPSFGRE